MPEATDAKSYKTELCSVSVLLQLDTPQDEFRWIKWASHDTFTREFAFWDLIRSLGLR